MDDVLDWRPDLDPDIRGTAVELRSRVARNVYSRAVSSQVAARSFLNSPRTAWRLRCLEKAEIFLGTQISGTVLEIGAGTGWCSAVLSRRSAVEKVYAVDYDPVSVNELMPATFSSLEADSNKITRVLGSFNRMALPNNAADFLISIGALHHSENLKKSFSESYRVLRGGGALIACEPCYFNSMTVSEQRELESALVDRARVEKLYGLDVKEVRAIDNSDHFYRLSEFEAAAYRCGFDVYPYVFDATTRSGGPVALSFRRLRDKLRGDILFGSRRTYRGYTKTVCYPYFAKRVDAGPVYDDLLLILVKPSDDGHR